ncbi:amidohydrolase family protein [Nonlabens sp. SY33080]|uniref:amidohydrolase family protein n=1 Tax=Nonlabens sp. SY33080 TaxID=2719911 RepID=UPI001428C7A6|nr:amidohydrolase family protein [Nonlabens sp. SY33080]
MKKILFLFFLWCFIGHSQEYFPNNDDISAVNNVSRAITNATVHTGTGDVIKNATILIKDGKIQSIGKNVSIPKDAVIEDANGNHIYPSFVEAYGDFSMKKPSRAERSRSQQYDEGRKGYYWNDHIRAEQNAIDYFKYDEKAAKKLLEAGYGTVQTHLHDGIARGTGMLVALNNNGDDGNRILRGENAEHFSLDRSVQTNQAYPTSLMGTLALLRQAHFDANWYEKGNSNTRDLSLEALIKNKNLIQIIEAGDKKNILRVDKVGDLVGKQFVIVGGEDAYEMIGEIKNTNASLIVPINFPDAYDVSNPYQEWYVSLGDMREWKQSPANLKVLKENNITFSVTAHGLKDVKKLHENIRQAMEYGLSEEDILQALTLTPARILKADDLVGSLEKGKLANFIMTSGPLFDKETKIFENWVQGSKHIIKNRHTPDVDGTYTTTLNGDEYKIVVSGDGKKATIKIDTLKLGSKSSFDGQWLNLMMTQKESDDKSYSRIVVQPDGKDLTGTVHLPSGDTLPVTLVASSTEEKEEDQEKEEDNKDKEVKSLGALTYPNLAYGASQRPQQETILYRNATVWTNEDDGILKNTDVLVKDGKIAKIGTNLNAGRARVIDATGKHLTSGIIDEHSHIAIDNGVNEAGHNSTAEVTIEDVVDHEDINLYRDLAGGVTTMQLLHGSANPIGGRSAIIKPKWGYPADEMILENSPKFIKFALGENVKQSRYQNGTRFPQSRMGVEQVFEDYFTRAREYEKTKGTDSFRYDEEMEVMLEILNKERFISCHSYVQSEINMLMKLAERHGFRVNTFTHILEGYKVADKMAEHGVGGSTFSDWWAYKYEVNDAIPYNGAIMHSQGVVTAFNSDDAEMSRRLNQEAAKAVKYGNVNEEDAWKFVTLNPAKLLHIDDRTGSIKVGKDADLVLWNDHPMSVTASADYTMIDGIIFFSKENDLRFRESIKKERQQLVNEMIEAKNKGMKTQTPKKREKELYECETINW